MLCLTRHLNQRILLAQGPTLIVVEVRRIDEHQVRLGFTAPPRVRILREELLEERLLSAYDRALLAERVRV